MISNEEVMGIARKFENAENIDIKKYLMYNIIVK